MKIILSVLLVCVVASCYYDNKEYLYPQTTACDTSHVTFDYLAPDKINAVQPILSDKCYQCHSNANYTPSVLVKLEDYADVVASANSGALIGTLRGTSPYPLMPPSGSISDCDISKIEVWKNNNYPK
jgi:hypothetical protein